MRRARLTIHATHEYVCSPDVAATLDLWVGLLTEAVGGGKPAAPDPGQGGPALPVRRRRRPA